MKMKRFKHGLSKYWGTSKKGSIEFKYVCYVASQYGEVIEKIYWQPDFNVKAATLKELKELLP
jgi:hypothetical protein